MKKLFEASEPIPGMPIERKFLVGANFKIIDEEQQIIEGYASTRNLDRDNEIVDPEAFRETMPRFMDNPVVMYGHETGGWQPLGKPIGKVIEWEIKLKGLWVKIQISRATQQAREIWMLIQENILRAFSIGFRPIKWEDDDETKIRTHLKLELYEISVVPIPANPEALMRQAMAKNLKLEIFKQKEDLKMKLKPGDPGYVDEEPTKLTLKGTPTPEDFEAWSQEVIKLAKHFEDLDKKVRELTGDPTALSSEHKEAMNRLLKVGEKIIANQEEMAKRFPKRDIVFDGRKVYGEGAMSYEEIIESPTKELSGVEKTDLEELQRKHDAITWVNHILRAKARATERRFIPVWDLVNQPGFVDREKDGRKSLARLVRDWQRLGNQFTGGKLEQELKTMATSVAGQGLEFIPTMFSAQLIDRIRQSTMLAGLLMNFDAPSDPWKFPVSGADQYGSSATQATAAPSAFDTLVNAQKTANVTFTHSKMRIRDFVSMEEIEDSIVAIVPYLNNKFSIGAAKTLERALINGQKTGAHQDYDVENGDTEAGKHFRIGITNCVLWNGLRWLCLNPATMSPAVIAKFDAGGAFTLAKIISARSLMGPKGVTSSDLVFVVSLSLYYLMLTQAAVQGMDVFGVNATIVRGAIESVYGMQVLPSAEFPANLAATGYNTLAGPNIFTGGIIVNKNAFAVSYRRGFELESQRIISTDQLEVVGFLRVAFEGWYQDSAGQFNESSAVPASYLFDVNLT